MAEERLIDANALIEHLNSNFYGDVIEEIKKFPTAKPKAIPVCKIEINTEEMKEIVQKAVENIRWTDKVYLDNQGDIRSTDGCPTYELVKRCSTCKYYEKRFDDDPCNICRKYIGYNTELLTKWEASNG